MALNKLSEDTLKATQNHIQDYSDLAVKVPDKSGSQCMNDCDYDEDGKWQLSSNVTDFKEQRMFMESSRQSPKGGIIRWSPSTHLMKMVEGYLKKNKG